LKTLAPDIYRFDCFSSDVLAASSGRGYTHNRREDFLKQLGIAPGQLVLVRQVHGAEIIRIQKQTSSAKPEADALITDIPGIALGILTADCVPVFLWDAGHRAVGLVHAGWRGLAADIISKTAAAMAEAFKSVPASLEAAAGPAIRACCYEVGEEFREYFPQSYRPPEETPKQGRMDLVREAVLQLAAAGLPENRIHDCRICTSCQNHSFFSARAEKTSERILSVIQMQFRT